MFTIFHFQQSRGCIPDELTKHSNRIDIFFYYSVMGGFELYTSVVFLLALSICIFNKKITITYLQF